jgi:hypothetical protein
LEQHLDPITRRRLTTPGIRRGSRLEVEAGGGSVAAWLCGQIGATGQVAATDRGLRLKNGRIPPARKATVGRIWTRRGLRCVETLPRGFAKEQAKMEIGAAIFFTDYSMAPTDLAVALEERGFDSLWVAEHSHIPAARRFSHPAGEAALTKEYYDVMDPFVTLSAAAAVTKRLKLGTAICLVIQRDTIQTAKAVASLDQLSKGRFLFGIGCGWNAEEMEEHGTVYETRTLKMREQIEAMKEIWTQEKPEYHGEIVDFPSMMTRPKPAQKPHSRLSLARLRGDLAAQAHPRPTAKHNLNDAVVRIPGEVARESAMMSPTIPI